MPCHGHFVPCLDLWHILVLFLSWCPSMYSMRRVWCLRHRAKCSCCLPSAAVFYYRATAPFPMSWHLPPGHWIHCQQVSIQRTEQWWLLLNWTFTMQVIQWIALWISFFCTVAATTFVLRYSYKKMPLCALVRCSITTNVVSWLFILLWKWSSDDSKKCRDAT